MNCRRVFPFSNPTGFHDLISGRRRGPVAAMLRALLRIAEVPYTWAAEFRNRRFDRGQASIHQVDVPVVSVGNITAGGTGKTPMVAWLANWFTQRGVPVALISRGYGAPAGETSDNAGNDEARELAQRLPEVPHLQNPDRFAAAQLAIDQHACQLIVLDDAFQHRRLHRDLDIVLIDALLPFGYGHVLPRGLLREPLYRLQRADLIALSRADAVDEARRRQLRADVTAVAPEAAWVEVVHRPQSLLNADGQSLSIDWLQGKRVAAFAGIGNPLGFYHSLEQLGCELVAQRAFPDHFHYDHADLVELQHWVVELPAVDAVVCTCKDLVKIDTIQIANCPLWAVAIDVDIVRGLDVLERLLDGVLPQK